MARRALLALLLPLAEAKLPFDALTMKLGGDCWVPDYCVPETFRYKICKLRMRGRAKPGDEFACAEDEFCEEVDCEHKCWLPRNCECHTEGDFVGRMLCDNTCFKHPSTQWGLCTKIPEGYEDNNDDEPLPVDYHFYTKDHLLYNAKLHINEDSPMKGEIKPKSKDEL